MYPCQRVLSVVIESYDHILSDVADEHQFISWIMSL